MDAKLDLKDSRQNPDAAYRLAKVLEYIDSSKISDGGERTGKVQGGKGDGNIEGITKDGDAWHGTEAGMVKDFAEKGYASLGSAHRLPTTSDTHVKKDGSNKDNFQWFAGEAGKHLWFLPGVSNVLTGIGNSEGGVKGSSRGAWVEWSRPGRGPPRECSGRWGLARSTPPPRCWAPTRAHWVRSMPLPEGEGPRQHAARLIREGPQHRDLLVDNHTSPS